MSFKFCRRSVINSYIEVKKTNGNQRRKPIRYQIRVYLSSSFRRCTYFSLNVDLFLACCPFFTVPLSTPIDDPPMMFPILLVEAIQPPRKISPVTAWRVPCCDGTLIPPTPSKRNVRVTFCYPR